MQTFESVAESDVARGVALCIRNTMGAYQISPPSPFFVGIQCMVGVSEWVVVSLYIPPKSNHGRRLAIAAIRDFVQSRLRGSPHCRILLTGDFNTGIAMMRKLIHSIHPSLILGQCVGNPASYYARRRWSALDHIVVSTTGWEEMGVCSVNRSWDISDHWLVETALQSKTTEAEVEEVPIRRMVSRIVTQKARDIATHNRWDALQWDEANDNPSAELDRCVENFVSTCVGVAEDVEATKVPNKNPVTEKRLDRPSRVAIQRHRRLEHISTGRVKAIWTAKEFINIRYLDEQWENQCPMCLDMGGPETLEHLFLKCSKWRRQRRAHLRPILRSITARGMLAGVAPSTKRTELRLRYLLGGTYMTDTNEARLLPHWLITERDEHQLAVAVREYVETGVVAEGTLLPDYIRVARFLHEVMPLRFKILGSLVQSKLMSQERKRKPD